MSAHSHEHTMRREASEEAAYEQARAGGLLAMALVDEMRSRMQTQVGSYQAETDRLRVDARNANDACDNSHAALRAKIADVGNLIGALHEANATITALAKKARVKATVIPIPLPTEPDYPSTRGAEAVEYRGRKHDGLRSPNQDAPPF